MARRPTPRAAPVTTTTASTKRLCKVVYLSVFRSVWYSKIAPRKSSLRTKHNLYLGWRGCLDFGSDAGMVPPPTAGLWSG